MNTVFMHRCVVLSLSLFWRAALSSRWRESRKRRIASQQSESRASGLRGPIVVTVLLAKRQRFSELHSVEAWRDMGRGRLLSRLLRRRHPRQTLGKAGVGQHATRA